MSLSFPLPHCSHQHARRLQPCPVPPQEQLRFRAQHSGWPICRLGLAERRAWGCSPVARGRVESQKLISDSSQRTARIPTLIGSGNLPSRISRYIELVFSPTRSSTSRRVSSRSGKSWVLVAIHKIVGDVFTPSSLKSQYCKLNFVVIYICQLDGPLLSNLATVHARVGLCVGPLNASPDCCGLALLELPPRAWLLLSRI